MIQHADARKLAELTNAGKTFPVRPAALAIIAVAAILPSACSRTPQQSPRNVPVTFVIVNPQPKSITAEYPAHIEASNTVEIRPRVGGLLLRQAALEGKRVRKGETLFVIDPAPYAAALAQAKGDLAKAEAALSVAARSRERAITLAQQNLVSKGELDAAVGAYEGGAAAVDAARAATTTAQLNLEFTNVTSPIDGIVGRVQVRAGGVVVVSQTLLANVYATDTMYVNFGVSESNLPQMAAMLAAEQSKRGPDTEFRIILADGSEYPQRGRIDFVDPAIDAQTGTLPVRLQVTNPEGTLHSNQFARVIAPLRTIDAAFVVPMRAVQELQGKNYLWIIGSDDTAQQLDVKMGPQLGREEWLVESGLTAKMKVIVDGAQRLQPGVRVTGQELSAQPASATTSIGSSAP